MGGSHGICRLRTEKSIPGGFPDAKYVRTRPQMEQGNGALPALEGKASQGLAGSSTLEAGP